jgi:hypothetical protein
VLQKQLKGVVSENFEFRSTRNGTCAGRDAEEEVAEDIQDYNGEGVLFQPHHPRHVLQGGAARQDRGTAAASDTSGGRPLHNGTQGPCGFTQKRTAKTRSVSSGPKYKQFSYGKVLNVIVTVVQQTMAESNGAVLEEA